MFNIKNLKGKVVLITHDRAIDSPAEYTTNLAEEIATWYGCGVVEMFSRDYRNIEEEIARGNIVIFECKGMTPEVLEELKYLVKLYDGIIILDRLGYNENFGLTEVCDIVLNVECTLEVFKDRYGDMVFKSPRGFKLVTQSMHMLENDDNYKGILTVEKHNKWYELYVIRPDRTIDWIYDPMYDIGLSDEPMWTNHVVNPYQFHMTAKHLGLCYDDATFSKVCEMYVSSVLGDWGMLASHLPKVGDDGPNT